MKAVVQRVTRAEVRVLGEVVGQVGAGLCVLVGVGRCDREEDAAILATKVVGLRIFADGASKMNHSLVESHGAILAVSQFTLHGDVSRGRRPSFAQAMESGRARELFESFCQVCRGLGVNTETGRFGAEMQVELVGDGPVTILLDTARSR